LVGPKIQARLEFKGTVNKRKFTGGVTRSHDDRFIIIIDMEDVKDLAFVFMTTVAVVWKKKKNKLFCTAFVLYFVEPLPVLVVRKLQERSLQVGMNR
jgi:hypothetical protein